MANVKKSYVVYLKQPEAAAIAGMSTVYFGSLSTSPDPPPKGPDGKYNSVELGEWIRRREVNKLTGSRGGDKIKGALLPQQEKARKDKAMADKYERENRVRDGELLELETVKAAAFDMVMRTRSRLLRVPAAAANLLTGMTERVDMQEVIEKEIRDALEELSTTWTEKADENG